MKLSIASFLATVVMLPLYVQAECDESTLQGHYAAESVLFYDERTDWENSPVPLSAMLHFDGAGQVEINNLYAAYFDDNVRNRAQIDGIAGSGTYSVNTDCHGLLDIRLDTVLESSSGYDDIRVDFIVRFVLAGRGLVAERISGTAIIEDKDESDSADIGTFSAVRSQLGAR